MSIDRFILGFAGFMVITGCLLALFVNHNFIYLSLFVGVMMFQSAFTKFCPMAWIVKKLGGQSKNFF